MAYRYAHNLRRQRSCSYRVSASHNISAGRDASAQTGEAARLLGLRPEVAGAELQPRLAAAAGPVPVPSVQPQPGHLQAGRHRAAAPRQGLIAAGAEVQEHRLARPQQVLQTHLPRARLQEDVLWVGPKVQLPRPHPGVLLLQLQQAAVQGMCPGETHAPSHG